MIEADRVPSTQQTDSASTKHAMTRRTALAGLAGLSAAGLPVATVATAMPTAAHTIAPAVSLLDDAGAAASLARAEQVVSLLRACYIREGWKIDEPAAERALAYCRKSAEDGSDPDEERVAAMDFFCSHGVSLDWVFAGDIGGLICGVAKHSERADSIADAELMALADQYIVAEQKFCDLNRKVDQMDSVRWDVPMPETLRWRESDAELGLPGLCPKPDDHPPIWDRPEDVDKLRAEKWLFCSMTETEDVQTVIMRKITPSAAARARAGEIIAAYDEWDAKQERKPRGYWKAVKERERADRAYMRIEQQIAETRAKTVEGLIAKLRCARAYAKSDDIGEIEGGSCADQMARSIFQDIRALAKERSA
jgi:hypothetical protein